MIVTPVHIPRHGKLRFPRKTHVDSINPDASVSVIHDADVDDYGTLGLSLSAHSCLSSLTNCSIDCLIVGDVHLQIPCAGVQRATRGDDRLRR